MSGILRHGLPLLRGSASQGTRVILFEMHIHVKLASMATAGIRPSADLGGTAGCACFILRRAARAVTRAYDDALRPSGLRSTQFTLLVAVAKLQPVSPGALAGIAAMEATTVSRSIALLVRAGLVSLSGRGPGRSKAVTLTRRGARTLDRALPLWRDAEKRMFSSGRGRRAPAWRDDVETLIRRMRGPACDLA